MKTKKKNIQIKFQYFCDYHNNLPFNTLLFTKLFRVKGVILCPLNLLKLFLINLFWLGSYIQNFKKQTCTTKKIFFFFKFNYFCDSQRQDIFKPRIDLK